MVGEIEVNMETQDCFYMLLVYRPTYRRSASMAVHL